MWRPESSRPRNCRETLASGGGLLRFLGWRLRLRLGSLDLAALLRVLLEPDGHRARDVPGRVGAGDDADEHRQGEVLDGSDAVDDESDERERGGAARQDGAAEHLVDGQVDEIA